MRFTPRLWAWPRTQSPSPEILNIPILRRRSLMSSVDTIEQAKGSAAAPRQRRLTIARAINEALHQEMAADNSVVVLGEDLAKIGGVWSTTVGLLDTFGPDRVSEIGRAHV